MNQSEEYIDLQPEEPLDLQPEEPLDLQPEESSELQNTIPKKYHIRLRALISEREINIFRMVVGLFAIIFAVVYRVQLNIYTLYAAIAVGALVIIYGIIVSIVLRSRKQIPFFIKYFSILLEIGSISTVLWFAGRFNTFKSEAFMLYFVFIALSAYRYSGWLILYAWILVMGFYITTFIYSVNNEIIVLGTLQQEYETFVVSINNPIIRLFFICAVSAILGIICNQNLKLYRNYIASLQKISQNQLKTQSTIAILERYVPKQIARLGLKNEGNLEGDKFHAAVLLLDFREFTKKSDGEKSEIIFGLLNDYLARLSHIVSKLGGIVSKYTGDGLLAVFGVPTKLDDPERRATIAALHMCNDVEQLNEIREQSNLITLEPGIAIDGGEVYAGSIGSDTRLEYTIIGTPVSQVAYLEHLNKQLNTKILISDTIYHAISKNLSVNDKGVQTVGDKNKKVHVYEALEFNA